MTGNRRDVVVRISACQLLLSRAVNTGVDDPPFPNIDLFSPIASRMPAFVFWMSSPPNGFSWTSPALQLPCGRGIYGKTNYDVDWNLLKMEVKASYVQTVPAQTN